MWGSGGDFNLPTSLCADRCPHLFLTPNEERSQVLVSSDLHTAYSLPYKANGNYQQRAKRSSCSLYLWICKTNDTLGLKDGLINCYPHSPLFLQHTHGWPTACEVLCGAAGTCCQDPWCVYTGQGCAAKGGETTARASRCGSALPACTLSAQASCRLGLTASSKADETPGQRSPCPLTGPESVQRSQRA